MNNSLFLLFSLLNFTGAIFFPQLGFGSMNCQCQQSCNSAPSQLGCLCPPPMPCYQPQQQNRYIQAPPVIYQQYQPQQQQLPPSSSSSYLANIPTYMQPYVQPSFVTNSPPLQVPGSSFDDNSNLNYQSSSQQFIAEQQRPESYGSPAPFSSSSAPVNLQPPAARHKEEPLVAPTDEKNYVYGTDNRNKLSDIFYETGPSSSEIDTEIGEQTVPTSTESLYQNTETLSDNRKYEVSTYPSSTSKQEPRNYELKRGEGSSDISMSGYGFETPNSSSSSPIMLEFLEQPRKESRNENQNQSDLNSNTDTNVPDEVTDFTKQVDEFYKSSTSTPPQTFEYGAVRDARQSSGKEEPSTTPKFPFDHEPELKSKWASKRKSREKEDNSKCNNPILRDLMEAKMTSSPSISKQMIYSAATEMWMGRNVNVICSKHSFSYVVVTSPIFCEHRKKSLTCFVFFQP